MKSQNSIKQNIKLTVLFMWIVIASCASNLQNVSNFNPDIDCSESSNFDFDQYQIKMQHPTRSTEAIWTKVNANLNGIINVVEDHSYKFPNKNRIEFSVGVNGNGEFFMIFFPDTIQKDTLFNNGIQKVCKTMKLDFLPNYFTVSKIKIVINDVNKLELIDSVHYYPSRTKKGIMCVVTNNLKSMRYTYNRHLRDDGYFSGKIIIKFAIDEHGNIIHAEIVEKTIDNKSFEEEELSLIKSWKFPEIYNPNDVTEVVYPFVFN